jgi:hypothetical protein
MALNRLVDSNVAQPLTLGTLRASESFTSYGQMTVWAGNQSTVGLIVRQALQVSGADIQQWQAADGAVFGRVNSSGEFHHGLNGATARFGVVTPIGTTVLVLSPPSAAYIGLVIRGFSAQTADLQQWQNSAGTIIGKLDSNANLTLNATGTGSIQLGDATITKTSGSAFQFNSGGNFSQQLSMSSGNFSMRPTNYAANQSGGITMTDAGANWTVGGFYLRSDGSGVPRFAFVPPQTALEVLTLNGNQVGINTSTPGTFGSGSVAAQLAINNYTANGVGLVVRAAGSQTANLQEWQNDAGSILARVNSGGQLAVPTIANTDGLTAITLPGSRNVQLGSATASLGGGVVVIGIANATTAPTSNPTGGGILYVDSGALKYLGTSGTAATIVNADSTETASDATLATAAIGLGYTGIPQNATTTGSYTVVAADAGKHIYASATRTVTINSNANLALPIGTTLTFIAGSGATMTIAITSDTMYLAGPGTTGSRTLAPFGIATAVKLTSTTWIISGNGLT